MPPYSTSRESLDPLLLEPAPIPGTPTKLYNIGRWISQQWRETTREVLRDLRSERSWISILYLLYFSWIGLLLCAIAVLSQWHIGVPSVSACQPDGNFSPYVNKYNIWASSGFFQITLAFGPLNFTTAKVIDICWDVTVEISVMWLKAHFKLPLGDYPETPKGWKAVISLSQGMNTDLAKADIDPHALKDRQVKDLQGGSVNFDSPLARPDFSFWGWLKDKRTREQAYGNKWWWVVPRASAVVAGQADAEPIAMHSDHIRMAKFSSREDVGYVTVSEYLNIMSESAANSIKSRWKAEANLNEDSSKGMAKLAMMRIASHAPQAGQPECWLLQRRLIRHVDRCMEIMTKHIKPDDEDYWYLGYLSGVYLDGGRLKEAEWILEWALQNLERVLGPDHERTLGTAYNLSLVYQQPNRLEAAEAMSMRAL
ncbi:hypothetical protein F4677DRAFT_458779 [Hypoxylon crocopeplum]|nr:hypothetical protein F4677DRAFT_458779 [Hypoxylon crocopeplum]